VTNGLLVAKTLTNIALKYGQVVGALGTERLLRRALEIREKALGPDDSEVSGSLDNLAINYHNQHQYTDAEPLYKRALAIREKALGPDHLDVAASLNYLAVNYNAQAGMPMLNHFTSVRSRSARRGWT